MPKYLTDRKLKISVAFIFEIKKKDNIFNFLKDSFFVMRGHIDMIFGVFSDTYVRLLATITSHFLQDIAKVRII